MDRPATAGLGQLGSPDRAGVRRAARRGGMLLVVADKSIDAARRHRISGGELVRRFPRRHARAGAELQATEIWILRRSHSRRDRHVLSDGWAGAFGLHLARRRRLVYDRLPPALDR